MLQPQMLPQLFGVEWSGVAHCTAPRNSYSGELKLQPHKRCPAVAATSPKSFLLANDHTISFFKLLACIPMAIL